MSEIMGITCEATEAARRAFLIEKMIKNVIINLITGPIGATATKNCDPNIITRAIASYGDGKRMIDLIMGAVAYLQRNYVDFAAASPILLTRAQIEEIMHAEIAHWRLIYNDLTEG